MKCRLWIVFWLAIAVFAGCSNRQGSRELVERELRYQEDEIYALQDQLQDMENMLEACRRENSALRQELHGGGASPTMDRSRSLTPEIELGEPAGTRMPYESTPREQAPPYEGPPIIDPIPPVIPGSEEPGTGFFGQPSDRTTRSSAAAVEPTDYIVRQVTLNRMLTGGRNSDGIPGDDGVLVVVEPRNALGQVINVPGEVSIVVMDPACEGPDARVARWDFTPDEAAARFREGVFGRGMHFELPWPNTPPSHRELNLVVRYTTADGQKFAADKSIGVELLSERTEGWTEAAPRGVAPPAMETPVADAADQTLRERIRRRRGRESASDQRGMEPRPAWAPFRQ